MRVNHADTMRPVPRDTLAAEDRAALTARFGPPRPDLTRGAEIAALRRKEEGAARRGVKHQPSTEREQRSLRLWLSDNVLILAYLLGCLSTALATWAAGAWK